MPQGDEGELPQHSGGRAGAIGIAAHGVDETRCDRPGRHSTFFYGENRHMRITTSSEKIPEERTYQRFKT